MPSKDLSEYEELARIEIEVQLRKEGLKLVDLLCYLNANSYDLNYKSLTNRIKRGKFSYAFFLMVLKCIGKSTEIITSKPDEVNMRVIKHLRHAHGLVIGVNTAKQILEDINNGHNPEVEVKGFVLRDGKPKEITKTFPREEMLELI